MGDKYAQDSIMDIEVVSYFPLKTISPLENAVKYYNIARVTSHSAELKYHKIMADKGDKDSAYITGRNYFDSGRIVKADKYFRIAALAGHVSAATMVTALLEENYSDYLVETYAAKVKEAFPFYKMAADGGDRTAQLVIKAHGKDFVKAGDAAGALDAAKALVGTDVRSHKYAYYQSLEYNLHNEFWRLAKKEHTGPLTSNMFNQSL